MHHMTKKSLLAKYAALAKAGASPIEVKNAITEAEKDLQPADVDEIVLEIFDQEEKDEQVEETAKTSQPEPEKALPAAAALQDPGKPDMTRGKKRYDIFRGQWHPRATITGPDGRDVVLKWEFMPEGKAVKTGVPMEPEKARIFNESKCLRIARTFTEQMIEVGSTEKVFDVLPNPYEVREIHS